MLFPLTDPAPPDAPCVFAPRSRGVLHALRVLHAWPGRERPDLRGAA